MRVRRISVLSALAFAVCAEPTWAFLDSPYITPKQPTAAQTISVNIYGGVCDAIVGLQGYPQITREGNNVRIVLFGVHYGEPEFCNLGVGTATTSIGSYPVGNYTLQVERRYVAFGGTWVDETLGVIPFAVTGAPPAGPASVPTLGVAGTTILLFALAGATLRMLRMRRAD